MAPSPVTAIMDDFHNLEHNSDLLLRSYEAQLRFNNKAVGSPIPVGKRNSSPLSECASFPKNIILSPQQVASINVATMLSEGHRKLDRSFSEPVRQAQSPVSQMTTGASRYKTELCKPFAEFGKCKYSDKCQFAHGHEELRSMARHPKYKTELCRTFHSTGFCGYGTRCHFIHNEDERRGASAASPGGSPPPMTSPRTMGSMPFLPEEHPIPYHHQFSGNFEIKPYQSTYGRSDFGPSSPQGSPTSSEAFFGHSMKNELSPMNAPVLSLNPLLGDLQQQDESFINLEKYSMQTKVDLEEITSKLASYGHKNDINSGVRLPIFQNLTTKV